MATESNAYVKYYEKVQEKFIPLNVHWDFTYRCDHKCVHCYITERKSNELSLAEAEALFDELAKAGTLTLLFSGGDPFVRPDAMDIIAAARARRFDVRINTHGNHITEAIADQLAELGVKRVGISVYSLDPKEHEAVTLIEGSHAKTIAACRMLSERGIKVTMKTPVVEPNQLSYHRVGELAKEIGAEWSLDTTLMPDDESDYGLCGIGVHPTERKLGLMKAFEDSGADFSDLTKYVGDDSDKRTCSAGTAYAYISPDGTLYPCLHWRDPIGNIRETPFGELWHHSPIAAKQREITRASYLSDCDGCSFHRHCSYCPGLSHSETGDAGRRSPHVCERTHLTQAAIEQMATLQKEGRPVPDPGTREAHELLTQSTFAERQWAARQAQITRPADRLRAKLVQIEDPRK